MRCLALAGVVVVALTGACLPCGVPGGTCTADGPLPGEGEGEGEGEGGSSCTSTFTFDSGNETCEVDLDCPGGVTRSVRCDDFLPGSADNCNCDENGFGGDAFNNVDFCERVGDAEQNVAGAAEQVSLRIDQGCHFGP